MYLDHFGLSQTPFSIAPNPRCLYLSARHREALAHLLYGVRHGGFVLLTGEVGTGKTTLCRTLLGQLPEASDVALIINPKLSSIDLLAAICDELGIDYPHDALRLQSLVDRLNRYLLEAHAHGRNTLLIIDEAQNLAPDVLEQIRLLTNLETHEKKLLQIILLGQPELRDIVARPELRQLAQRITVRYHLTPLSRDETAAYIVYRLAAAGGRKPLFPPRVVARIHRYSGGVPRLINLLCDRALLGAYARNAQRVNRAAADAAAREILGATRRRRRILLWSGLLLAVATALLLLSPIGAQPRALWERWTTPPPAAAAAEEAAKAENTEGAESAEPTEDAQEAPQATTPAPAQANRPATPTATRKPPRRPPPKTAAKPPPKAAKKAPQGRARTSDAPAKTGATAAMAATPRRAPEAARETAPRQQRAVATPIGGDRGAAYRSLLRLWQLHYLPAEHGAPCAFARAHGLHCLSARGGLAALRSFNRPALLELRVAAQRPRFAALATLEGDSAELAWGEQMQRIAPTRLAGAGWTGRFSLLWRPPPGYAGPIRPHDHHPALEWLTMRLETLLGEAIQPTLNLSGDLLEAVYAFRRRERLPVETPAARANPLTPLVWMRLNDALRLERPRLTALN